MSMDFELEILDLNVDFNMNDLEEVLRWVSRL